MPISSRRERPLLLRLSPVLQASFLLLLLNAAYLVAKQAPAVVVRYADLHAEAKRLRLSGQIPAAVRVFKKIESLAAAAGDETAEAMARLGESACYIRLFEYREALAASDEAFRLASGKDRDIAGAAIGNKATIYIQVGDSLAAADAANKAIDLLQDSSRRDHLALALLNAADAQTDLHRADLAFPLFRRSIAVAQAAQLPGIEAMSQDHLGVALLQAGDPTGAEKALLASQQLFGEAKDAEDELVAKQDLAELYFAKKQYRAALELVDEVLRPAPTSSLARYWPLQLRGNVLLALERPREALAAFEQAVTTADVWRGNVLAGDATRLHTVVSISSIYQDYVDLAARLSLENGDRNLSRHALTVLIDSRAWSLREEMLAAYQRKLLLPPRYFELLSQLGTTQALVTLGSSHNAQDVKNVPSSTAKLQQIQRQLQELQNQLGVPGRKLSTRNESSGTRTSLRDIQRSLSRKQLLLSFSLSDKSSFVWTVTRDQVHLSELANSADMAKSARAFSAAVQHGKATLEQGLEMNRMLFSSVPASAQALPEWLIAADGPLLNGFPFAALPDLNAPQHSYLISGHTLRLVPSEVLLAGVQKETLHQGFLGVADPIYNAADVRRSKGAFPKVKEQRRGGSLSRLPGSEQEVRTSAAFSGQSKIQILTGADASIPKIQSALESQPEVVHFAVHVVSPSATGDGAGADEAALAVSLAPSGFPELLTKESIASLQVPGSLIVLSGCFSQQGQVLPSAGIIGLSRAWLIAGAAAVLVTGWATPDDSGEFFQSFYKHFHTASGNTGERAALALRNTQSEMYASSGYRNRASYWSAYSVISKE